MFVQTGASVSGSRLHLFPATPTWITLSLNSQHVKEEEEEEEEGGEEEEEEEEEGFQGVS